MRENKNARKGIATLNQRQSRTAIFAERENKNARKGIATPILRARSACGNRREKTKTPARALRRESPARGSPRDCSERKQKRPQGHCDEVPRDSAMAQKCSPRENKNARKGIAT